MTGRWWCIVALAAALIADPASAQNVPAGDGVRSVLSPTPTTLAPLPNTGIVANPAITLFQYGDDLVVPLPLVGVETATIAVRVGAARVVRATAGGETGTAATIHTSGECGKPFSDAPVTVQPNGSATLPIRFCGIDRPGEYHARFDLVGDAGGRRAIDVAIKLRSPWWIALGIMAVGGLLGALLSLWRDTGRGMADALLSAITLSEAITAMMVRLGDARRIALLDPLLDRTVALRTAISENAGANAIAAQLTELTGRAHELNRLLWQLALAAGLPASAKLNAAVEDALGAIALANLPSATAGVDRVASAVEEIRAASAVALVPGDQPQALNEAAIEPPLLPIFRPNDTRGSVLRKRLLGDALAAIGLFALFAVVALQALWWGNPIWGDWNDQAVVFLTGAGAFGGLTTLLGTFRTTVQQSRGG